MTKAKKEKAEKKVEKVSLSQYLQSTLDNVTNTYRNITDMVQILDNSRVDKYSGMYRNAIEALTKVEDLFIRVQRIKQIHETEQ